MAGGLEAGKLHPHQPRAVAGHGAPVIFKSLAGQRMAAGRRQIRERFEHVSVLQDFGARQPHRRVGNPISVQQQVKVQSAGRETRAAAHPTALSLDFIERRTHLRHGRLGFKYRRQVQEIVALKTEAGLR